MKAPLGLRLQSFGAFGCRAYLGVRGLGLEAEGSGLTLPPHKRGSRKETVEVRSFQRSSKVIGKTMPQIHHV